MITAKENLIGKLNAKKTLIGKINNKEIEIYPELEDLIVTPSSSEQKFKSSKYGYDNVTVKAVESEELNIVPGTEEQTKQGLYKKVTVIGDSDLVPENIAENKEIFGVKGAMIASWDTSQIRRCSEMFYENTEMIEAPYFDTSNVTDMSGMFGICENLITVPQFNTSNVTNMYDMFVSCENLTTVPQFNTSKVTSMSGMFSYCTNLTTVPQFDTSNVTNMSKMFVSCENLTTVPQFNTSKVTTMSDMFLGCRNLTTVPLFNTSKVTTISSMFSFCNNLTNLGGVKDLGKAYTRKTSNYSSYKLDLSYCKKLTHESLISVINSLYDLNLTYDVANGGTLYTQQLILGSTNIAKLTAEEIAIATNKRLDSFLERREYEIFLLYKTKNDSSRKWETNTTKR